MAVDVKKDVKKAVTKPKTTKAKTVVEKEKAVSEDTISILMNQIAELKLQIDKNNVEPKIVSNVEEKPTKQTPIKRASFQNIRDEEIMVKRVIGGIGSVSYKDKKTGDEYIWQEIGDTEYITGDALKRMNTSPFFLKTPWLRIIENDDAIEVFNLKELYSDIDSIEDVDGLLKMSDSQITELINKLSKEYKQVLATNIMSKVSSGELSNINIIRKFEGLLGKEFLV